MKRTILAVLAIALVATACSPKYEDLTNVENAGESTVIAEVRDPDSVTVYRNVDGYANINVLCIGGDAVINRSEKWGDYVPTHVPGPNGLCP